MWAKRNVLLVLDICFPGHRSGQTLGFIVRLRQNVFLLCIIYYTNSHLAKIPSGNNFFLFYFYLKYYVEDVVCESQAH